MIFNSTTFLVFFLVFFLLYWFLNNRSGITSRNIFTIVASYLFYGWWDWRFLTLIFISSLSDFLIGLFLENQENKNIRKVLLYSSLIINLGILGFFKYFNFFIDSFIHLGSVFSINLNASTLNIILPVGISFYTFQTLSYTVDIYKERLKPTRNIISFFAFVSFFPQLVAGPIERAGNLLHQFSEVKVFNKNTIVGGVRLILWGFFKKIVLADNFGLLTDNLFNSSTNGLTILLGTVCFAIQIYADFSGYSDIAIGVSKMLGFNLMRNFNTPYFAKSFSEFWQRWHISLSTWFKDYVYIPLGGNRKSVIYTYRNLLITFLLSGLWHGANVTFLIWGGMHGIILVIEKYFKLYTFGRVYSLFVLPVILFLWLPFRADSASNFFKYLQQIMYFKNYSLSDINSVLTVFSLERFLFLLVTLLLFFYVEYFLQNTDCSEWIKRKSLFFRYAFYYGLIILILLIGNFSVKPNFIYFQF